MSKRYKILCYLDFDKGRDIEILMPVVYYIEKYLNADVKFAFIYDLHLIYKEKPQAILIANAIGSKLHHLTARYARQNNIPVFAMISEGNFRTDGTFDYWGFNTDKKLYQENVCLWSKRTFDFLRTQIPEYKDKMVLTGATGFDRYKIYQFADRDTVLKRLNVKPYKKVVTYFGWAFGKLFNEPGVEELRAFFIDDNVDERLKWLEQQMYLVEDILRETIEKNPDTLFIMKRHPNEKHPHITQPDKNEMVRLDKYPNAIYILQENVHDLINISDFVLGFETTTALETWCMKPSPTILLNPEVHFKRDKLFLGSHIVSNYSELQSSMDEFYATGTIAAFNTPEKKQHRDQLIKDTIGFNDGLNHIRTSYYFGKMLEKVDIDHQPVVKRNLKYWRWYYMIRIGKPFYCKYIFKRLPKFKKTLWVYDNIALKNRPALQKQYYQYLDSFHAKNNIPEAIKTDNFWKDLLNNPTSN